jgi:hypothetical protein|tara:strand:+ start:320 stop:520 length:201 start_codon:yes stop_codon:yes gene_type:complete
MMDRIEKLMNLLENKYGNKTITEGSKLKIREIVKQEIERVVESLKEVDDSDNPMTLESLEKVIKKN